MLNLVPEIRSVSGGVELNFGVVEPIILTRDEARLMSVRLRRVLARPAPAVQQAPDQSEGGAF